MSFPALEARRELIRRIMELQSILQVTPRSDLDKLAAMSMAELESYLSLLRGLIR